MRLRPRWTTTNYAVLAGHVKKAVPSKVTKQKAVSKEVSKKKATEKRANKEGTAQKAGGRNHTDPDDEPASDDDDIETRYTSEHGTPEDYYGVYQLDEPRIINKYLEVRMTPHKGRGIFTRVANIPAGTLLLQEKVLLQDHDAGGGRSEQAESTRFRRLVKRLSREDRQKFIALSHHGEPNNEESRFDRNNFGFGSHNSAWFWISFANHSCKPMCTFDAVHGKDEVGILRANVPIPKKGTEISIDYISNNGPKKLKEARKQHAQESWGFRCTCSACKSTSDQGDRQITYLNTEKDTFSLSRLSRLNPRIIANRESVDDNIDKFVKLALEWRMLPTAYDAALGASKFYGKLKDDLGRAHAIKWGLEASRISIIWQGIESIESADDRRNPQDRDGNAAPEPRFLRVDSRKQKELFAVVDKLVPQLIRKKLYGNVQAQAGPDISDLPTALY